MHVLEEPRAAEQLSPGDLERSKGPSVALPCLSPGRLAITWVLLLVLNLKFDWCWVFE